MWPQRRCIPVNFVDYLRIYVRIVLKLQRGSLFNKVASLKVWRSFLAVLERDSSTGFSSVNFVKFLATLFCRIPPSNQFSHDVVFFFYFANFYFFRLVRFAAKNQFIWSSCGKLGERIHKPVQSCVVIEIRWKLHCQVVGSHVPT